MGTTNILDLNNRVGELEKAVSGGDSAQANKSDIATEFSTTTSYTAGCFVYYGGKLYQFNADHSAGAWDPTDVVEANVTDQVVSNKAAIDGLTASDVAYDNANSGLTADTVQGALDELRQADNIMMSDGVTSVEDALDGLIEDSSDTLFNTTYLYENATITKKDSVVMIQWKGLKGLTNQTINTLSGLIPQKYRPSAELVFDLCSPFTTPVLDIYRIQIKKNGDVTVYPYNGVSAQHNLNTTITYLI